MYNIQSEFQIQMSEESNNFSGPCLALELVMEDAVNKFAQLAIEKVS